MVPGTARGGRSRMDTARQDTRNGQRGPGSARTQLTVREALPEPWECRDKHGDILGTVVAAAFARRAVAGTRVGPCSEYGEPGQAQSPPKSRRAPVLPGSAPSARSPCPLLWQRAGRSEPRAASPAPHRLRRPSRRRTWLVPPGPWPSPSSPSSLRARPGDAASTPHCCHASPRAPADGGHPPHPCSRSAVASLGPQRQRGGCAALGFSQRGAGAASAAAPQAAFSVQARKATSPLGELAQGLPAWRGNRESSQGEQGQGCTAAGDPPHLGGITPCVPSAE